MNNNISWLKAGFFLLCALLFSLISFFGVSNRVVFAVGGCLTLFIAILQLEPFHSWFFNDVIKVLKDFFKSLPGNTVNGMTRLRGQIQRKRDFIYLFIIFLLVIFDPTYLFILHLPPPPPPPCHLSKCFSVIAMPVDENGNGTFSLMNVGISMENSKQPFVFNQYDAYNHHAEQNIEGYIAQENLQYPTMPYATLILVTALSQTITDPSLSSSVGLSDLRGAYIAQYNYNHDISNTIKLRLYIANFGTRIAAPRTIPTIMRQIMAYANSDPQHFIGIVGLPFSSSALAALSGNSQSIPMVSSSASSDGLSNSPHFRRIVPPDSVESQVMKAFLTSNLPPPSTQTALFLDDGKQCNANGSLSTNSQDTQGEPYSNDLGRYIYTYFPDNFPGAVKESYQEGNPDSLNNCVQDVKNKGYSQIFFAGFADDLNTLRNKLKEQGLQNIRILGGEGLYDLGAYSPGNYDNLLFTTFAAYAEIDSSTDSGIPSKLNNISIKHGCPAKPLFDWEFCQFFSVSNPPSVYGYDLPEMHTLLTYDALNAFINILPTENSGENIPLWQTIDGKLSNVQFTGVTGRITFGTASDPINKPVYVACTTNTGLTQLVAKYDYDTRSSQVVQPPVYLNKSELNTCLLT